MVLRLKAFNNLAQGNALGKQEVRFVLRHDYLLDEVQIAFGANIKAF